ncbi:MAG: 3-oxoacyl-ACP reductase family protein [Oscillospiraceae bacterium]|nr:3-oxoacyl-ACP reductase family protein [Oscillospiraceae bacterium]
MNKDYANMLDFHGKVVVVTGAGHGMGTGIARCFGKAGATVAVTCHGSRDGAEAVCQEIREMGSPAEVFVMDQSSPDDCQRAMDEIAAKFGHIDALVNNAGININKPTMEISEEIWDAVMDTNVKGFFFCSQAAAKHMIAQGNGGAIVSVASINGFTPLPDGAHYGASKAGIIMGTRSLAMDFGQYGIRVNAVAPGLMDAPGLDAAVPGWRERYVSRAPLKRIGKWEDIGNVCLFLTSPLSDWVTGQTIIADGGVVWAPAY